MNSINSVSSSTSFRIVTFHPPLISRRSPGSFNQFLRFRARLQQTNTKIRVAAAG
jgi:hypothetical protein